MEDQLISFETAKLANKKGFFGNGNIMTIFPTSKKHFDISNIAPTQSLLQAWLRKEHNIHVTSHCKNTKKPKGTYTLTVETNNETEYYHYGWNTYEEALEKGLQEGLKLISK